MELTHFRDWITDFNPMYLAATGSVTLGVSLILAAAIVQLRRFRARTRQANAPASPQAEQLSPAPAVFAPPVAEPLENPALRHLLARLKAAGDKLENAGAAQTPLSAGTPDSRLKKAPSGVDYIHRAGTG